LTKKELKQQKKLAKKGKGTAYALMGKDRLRKHLKARDLSTKGSKDELVQRLQESDAGRIGDESYDDEIDDAEQAEIERENEAKEAARLHLQRAHAEFAGVKAPKLRKELERRGLSTEGKKAVLMERLASAIDAVHSNQCQSQSRSRNQNQSQN
jgi:hypothetical protein